MESGWVKTGFESTKQHGIKARKKRKFVVTTEVDSTLGYLSPMLYEQRWHEAQRKMAA